MSHEAPQAAPATEAGPRLVVWPKRILYAGYVCGALLLAGELGLSRAPTVALIGFPLLACEGLFRRLGTTSLRRFDHALMGALQRDESQLLALYRSHRLMRLCAPRHQLFDKLGFIYRRLGDHAASARAYREAYTEAPSAEAPLYARKLADALYSGSRYAEAETYYRLSQDDKHINAGVRARLARLVTERNGSPREAEQWMREAVEAAKGQAGCGKLRCQLVQMLLDHGKLEDAVWQLQLAEEEIGDADADEEQQALAAARAAVERAEAGRSA